MHWIVKLIGLAGSVTATFALISMFIWDYLIVGRISLMSVIGTVVFWLLYFKYIFSSKKEK